MAMENYADGNYLQYNAEFMIMDVIIVIYCDAVFNIKDSVQQMRMVIQVL